MKTIRKPRSFSGISLRASSVSSVIRETAATHCGDAGIGFLWTPFLRSNHSIMWPFTGCFLTQSTLRFSSSLARMPVLSRMRMALRSISLSSFGSAALTWETTSSDR